MSAIKYFFKANGPLIILVLVGFAVAWHFVDPAPPKTFTIAAGAKDGRYYQVAERLKQRLARDGITVNVLETQGAAENLDLLAKANRDVSIGFVQTGVERLHPDATTDLRSLGSLYYEPLWVFYRSRFNKIETLADLAGSPLAIGTPGSGTNAMARFILGLNGVPENDRNGHGQWLEVGMMEAKEALLSGQVDAAFFVLPADHPLIRQLANAKGIDFLSMRRAPAYESNFPFLSSIVINEGLLDLKTDEPAQDRRVLASLATLVVNPHFHPGLTPLVLESLQDILVDGGMLERPGQFPSPSHVGFALTPEARHFYRQGPPFLQRYLPFWAASLVDRLIILIIPFMAMLVPMVKLAGPIYRWRVRSRIYRWYRYLRAVDRKLREDKIHEDLAGEIQHLRELQREISGVDVPLSYADNLYALQLHVKFVIDRLVSMQTASKKTPTDTPAS